LDVVDELGFAVAFLSPLVVVEFSQPTRQTAAISVTLSRIVIINSFVASSGAGRFGNTPAQVKAARLPARLPASLDQRLTGQTDRTGIQPFLKNRSATYRLPLAFHADQHSFFHTRNPDTRLPNAAMRSSTADASVQTSRGAHPCRPDWASIFVQLSKFLHQSRHA